MSFRYTSYIEHGDELNHPMLDVSEFLSEVDNPEDNIEYCKEGRKAHQEALVNSPEILCKLLSCLQDHFLLV